MIAPAESAGLNSPAKILAFPSSRICRAVRVERERDGDAWIVIADAVGDIFGSYTDAIQEACVIARTLDLTIRSSAGISPC